MTLIRSKVDLRKAAYMIGMVLSMAVLIGSAGYFLSLKRFKAFDLQFEKLSKGADLLQVQAVLGPPKKVTIAPVPYWGNTPISEKPEALRGVTFEYPFSFYRITFKVAFDRENLLIGKHRYD